MTESKYPFDTTIIKADLLDLPVPYNISFSEQYQTFLTIRADGSLITSDSRLLEALPESEQLVILKRAIAIWHTTTLRSGQTIQ